jgi:hypothetical protein
MRPDSTVLQPTAVETSLDTEENYQSNCVANTETASRLYRSCAEIKCNLGVKGK